MKILSNNTLSFKQGLLFLGVTLLIGLLLTLNSASAQEPSGAATTPDRANFYQIQKQFNDYWKGRKVTKGSGYKPFKRWEWYWEPRVNPDGTFPPNNVIVKEWERYSAEQLTDVVAGNWIALGPRVPVDRYTGVGRINCMAFHPKDPNTFWVGTPGGGLWKTVDYGKTWKTNYDNKPVLGVSDIAIHPKKPDTMYIATGDYDGSGAGTCAAINGMANGDTKSVGVMKSVDGGKNWDNTGLNWNLSGQVLISRLIMHPNNPDTLFAATSDSIYRTMDGGTTWVHVGPQRDFGDIVFHPVNPEIIYAASRINGKISAQIWRSVNLGVTWDSVTKFANIKRIKLAVTKQSPEMLEAVCVSEIEGLSGIYRLNYKNSIYTITDTLVKVMSNCSNNYLHSAHDPELQDAPCGGQGDYDLCYTINPKKLNERWLGGVNTYKSTDGGREFNLRNYWNTDVPGKKIEKAHADKHWFAFHPLDSTFFECNDGGLLYTRDGGETWSDLTNGMELGQVYRIGNSWLEEDVIIAGFQDNGSQIDSAGTWLAPATIGGDGMECLIDYENPKIQYAAYIAGVIHKTVDNWKTIDTISKRIFNGKQPTGAWITPYVIHPIDPEVLYAGYTEIYKTGDRGNKWTLAGAKLPAPPLSRAGDTSLRILAISGKDPGVMFAARMYQLFKTPDGWKTPQPVILPMADTVITGIAFGPQGPDTVFITFSGYNNRKVFYSNNGGVQWHDMSIGLPKVPVNCIVYEEGTNKGLYVGTDLGVYYKNATMDSWIQFNNKLPNVMVTDLEIEYGTGKIRAATFGRGIWESDLYVASGTNKINEKEIPKDGGVATGGGVYETGSSATLNATPSKSNGFLGWYEDGVKVHDATTYTFVVEKNRNLIAKFGNPIGMEDIQKTRIHLFPNPTKGLVEVRLDKGVCDNLQKTTVTNMQGTTVYESAVKVENDWLSVDLSANPQGNYLITFYFKSGEKISQYVLLTK